MTVGAGGLPARRELSVVPRTWHPGRVIPVGSLAGQGNYVVVIYRDRWILPVLFGDRFPWAKRVRTFATHLNPADPRSLLAVLNEETRIDYERGRESDLAPYSMRIWTAEEWDCVSRGDCRHDPPCGPMMPPWRYTPQMFDSCYGTVAV